MIYPSYEQNLSVLPKKLCLFENMNTVDVWKPDAWEFAIQTLFIAQNLDRQKLGARLERLISNFFLICKLV